MTAPVDDSQSAAKYAARVLDATKAWGEYQTRNRLLTVFEDPLPEDSLEKQQPENQPKKD